MATVEALKDKKDIELLKTVLKQRSIRHYLLFVVGCNTGLRIGDILRLKVSDFITGERRTVKKHLIINEQKTGKVRQIAINGTIQKTIKVFLTCYNPGDDDYLFISRKGTNNATLLIAEGVDYKTISSRLGHSQISTLFNIYGHRLRKPDKKAADSLQNLLIKNSEEEASSQK